MHQLSGRDRAFARLLVATVLRRLGQGFVRSNDIIHTLADLGCDVTVYPLFPTEFSVAAK